MKTAKNILAKSLIIVSALFIMSFTSNPLSDTTKTSDTETVCGVSDTEVDKYLISHGYTVISLELVEGSCNRLATTQNDYQTIVYVEEGIIIGHEDVE